MLINRFKVAGASNNNGKGGRQAAPVDVGSPLLDWEEGDHFSFEDSERFEGDSLCSWSSEPESLCNNWRGWRRPNLQNSFGNRSAKKSIQGNKLVNSADPLSRKGEIRPVLPNFTQHLPLCTEITLFYVMICRYTRILVLFSMKVL